MLINKAIETRKLRMKLCYKSAYLSVDYCLRTSNNVLEIIGSLKGNISLIPMGEQISDRNLWSF